VEELKAADTGQVGEVQGVDVCELLEIKSLANGGKVRCGDRGDVLAVWCSQGASDGLNAWEGDVASGLCRNGD